MALVLSVVLFVEERTHIAPLMVGNIDLLTALSSRADTTLSGNDRGNFPDSFSVCPGYLATQKAMKSMGLSGLQIRVDRFDSGTRLQGFQWVSHAPPVA